MGRTAGSTIETVNVDDLCRWTYLLTLLFESNVCHQIFLKMHGVKMIELPTRSKYLILYRYALSTIMISYNIRFIYTDIHNTYICIYTQLTWCFSVWGRPMRCIWVFFRELHMFGAAIWKFWPWSRCHSDGKQVGAHMDAKRQKKNDMCEVYIGEKKKIYIYIYIYVI